MVAMQGLAFCPASRTALNSLQYKSKTKDFKHDGLALFAASTAVFIGYKLVIAISCGLITWIWVANMYLIESALFPVLLTSLLGYFIAGVVFQTFQATVETILVLFDELPSTNTFYESFGNLNDILKKPIP